MPLDTLSFFLLPRAGTVSNSWQALQPGGVAIPSLGGIFTGTVGTSTAFVPANVAVNGIRCSIVVLSGQGSPANEAPPIISENLSPPPPAVQFLSQDFSSAPGFCPLIAAELNGEPFAAAARRVLTCPSLAAVIADLKNWPSVPFRNQ